MRIVFFIDHLRHDGTQRVLKQLVEGLSARKHRLAVVCLDSSWDEELVARLRAVGAEVRVIGRYKLLAVHGLLGLWLWLRHRQFEVAVTFLAISDIIGRPLARLAAIPYVISSIRARNSHYSPWKLAVVRGTMPLADAVIVNSSATCPWAIEGEGAPAEHTFSIPNGVDIEAYADPYSKTQLCAALGLPPERLLIGCVGRLTSQKGQDLLLQALAQLRRHDADLLLVGEGEAEAALRALSDQLGLAGRVHFAGYRRDVAKILGALDLYVHPARFEGMPNALLEAMAAGCPIVASDVDGNSELLLSSACGWLVPADNVTGLATAMDEALGDLDGAKRRGVAAQMRAATSFSVAAMVEAWERVLIGAEIPYSPLPLSQ